MRTRAAEPPASARFRNDVLPILTKYCVSCHNADLRKGNIAFDEIEAKPGMLDDRQLWWKTLKMVRGGLMPPKNKVHPESKQLDQLISWIKTDAFKGDPRVRRSRDVRPTQPYRIPQHHSRFAAIQF